MSECLGEVAQCCPGIGIYFFGEKTEIARSAEQVFEQLFGFIESAASGQIVDPPESADPEGAFSARHPVIPLLVTVDQVAANQLFDDAIISRDHPGIANLLVAEAAHLQQGGVEAVATKLADIASEFSTEPLVSMTSPIDSRSCSNSIAVPPETNNALAIERQQAIERHPAHDFRERELSG